MIENTETNMSQYSGTASQCDANPPVMQQYHHEPPAHNEEKILQRSQLYEFSGGGWHEKGFGKAKLIKDK